MEMTDMFGKLNFHPNAKNKINPTQISIEKNVIALDNRTLQISNVSQLFVAEPNLTIPWLAAVLFILSSGGFMLFRFWSMVGMILTGFYIYLVIMENLNKGYYIYVNLNSGFTYLIHCENKSFAEKVREVIEDCINDDHRKGKVVINMKQENIQIDRNVWNVDQSIHDSTVIAGDQNEVNNGVNDQSKNHYTPETDKNNEVKK
ncbi:hypothetical protein [Enterococcus sp. AZ101]|uniref:hypothetical protein n=1 Tax=Enterococcus sp. AZ101 TaxID=2774742 RepID=UPI003D2923B7